jgi:enoyl-CoA hydratase
MAPDFTRYERIVATRGERILTLTLTAPNPVNAVDGEMHHELSRIFLDAQDDPASDLIVLTGAGRAFCAGGDTAWFKTHIENPASFRALGPEAKRIITSLLDPTRRSSATRTSRLDSSPEMAAPSSGRS